MHKRGVRARAMRQFQRQGVEMLAEYLVEEALQVGAPPEVLSRELLPRLARDRVKMLEYFRAQARADPRAFAVGVARVAMLARTRRALRGLRVNSFWIAFSRRTAAQARKETAH